MYIFYELRVYNSILETATILKFNTFLKTNFIFCFKYTQSQYSYIYIFMGVTSRFFLGTNCKTSALFDTQTIFFALLKIT